MIRFCNSNYRLKAVKRIMGMNGKISILNTKYEQIKINCYFFHTVIKFLRYDRKGLR